MASSATASTSFTARLASIMGDVGRVEKKGEIRGQSGQVQYNFARDSDVLEAVIPKLAAAGLVLVPEFTEVLSMEPNARGTQLIANIRTSWHITDGTDSLRFQTLGQGQDTGDKALPKAQSNARKYALFMLFHIVTGDDPDQHASDEPAARPARAGDGGVNNALGFCPVHHKPFRLNSRGGYCPTKNDDGTWCDQIPTGEGAAMVKQILEQRAQESAPPVEQAPAAAATDVDDIPF